jgi:hypothetical protein
MAAAEEVPAGNAQFPTLPCVPRELRIEPEKRRDGAAEAADVESRSIQLDLPRELIGRT